MSPAWSDTYFKLLEVEMSVADNVIGLVNTEIFGPGLQELRLAVLDIYGELIADSVCIVPVVFTAP